MQLINWEIAKQPANWLIIWLIVAIGVLAVTAVKQANGSL